MSSSANDEVSDFEVCGFPENKKKVSKRFENKTSLFFQMKTSLIICPKLQYGEN